MNIYFTMYILIDLFIYFYKLYQYYYDTFSSTFMTKNNITHELYVSKHGMKR